MRLTKEKVCPSCGFCASLVSEHTKRIATIVEQKLLAELAKFKEIFGDLQACEDEDNEQAAERLSLWIDNFHKMKAELAEAKAQVAAAHKLIEKWERVRITKNMQSRQGCAIELRAALESKGKAAHERTS